MYIPNLNLTNINIAGIDQQRKKETSTTNVDTVRINVDTMRINVDSI
jgi:hypothetical protein